jgi:hypothetical protein
MEKIGTNLRSRPRIMKIEDLFVDQEKRKKERSKKARFLTHRKKMEIRNGYYM